MIQMKEFLVAGMLAFALAGCGASTAGNDAGEAEGGHQENVSPNGPHGGRLLADGGFALEITIFEDGVPPEFRVYPYKDGVPVDPATVSVSMELSRLSGEVDRFAFAPDGDFLRGDAIVGEPHSFDVKVTAEHDGASSNWTYPSYEGRTTIKAAQAEAAGVAVEKAGPAMIEDRVALSGRIELQPEGKAEIVAWYPGRIVELTKTIGETVAKDEIVARVTSRDSLETYAIKSPIAGVVMQRHANVGDVADDAPLYLIADARQVHAEFYVYPKDAASLKAGQKVAVRSLDADHEERAEIEAVLPTADLMTQTIVAHVHLLNSDLKWRPGQAVEGVVSVAGAEAPLAVRTRALQRFRDFTVVFAQVGETYEVRMLKLGRRNPDWTEVMSGLRPGETYVTDNAFLIRADIEKSGASHDH